MRKPRYWPMRTTYGARHEARHEAQPEPRDVRVRRLGSIDSNRVGLLYSRCRPHGGQMDLVHVGRELTASAAFGVEVDRRLVGFSVGYGRHTYMDITDVLIDPAHRRQGYGRLLIETYATAYLGIVRRQLVWETPEPEGPEDFSTLAYCRFFAACGFRSCVHATASGPTWRFTRSFDHLNG